jgi:hypothetical protein
MNGLEIATLVTESARRFGERNPQQRQQLADRLSKLDARDVMSGLLRVFGEGQPPPLGSAAQELAGVLLVDLVPKGSIDLEPLLRSSLSRYEMSVEQFPHYLAMVCGVEAVSEALTQIEAENLSEAERRALLTLRFWLRQYSERKVAT